MADILAAGKARIVHVHVADAPDLPPEQIRDNERLMPGEGVIDLKGFFKALEADRLRRTRSARRFSGRGLREMAARAGRAPGSESTRKVMEKAGVPWK